MLSRSEIISLTDADIRAEAYPGPENGYRFDGYAAPEWADRAEEWGGAGGDYARRAADAARRVSVVLTVMNSVRAGLSPE